MMLRRAGDVSPNFGYADATLFFTVIAVPERAANSIAGLRLRWRSSALNGLDCRRSYCNVESCVFH